VALFGANGRMGQRLQNLLQTSALSKNFELVGLVDRGVGQLDDLAQRKPAVVIDFSLAGQTAQIASWCLAHQVRLVSGTTGLTKADTAAIKKLSKKRAVLWSPNMSIGLNAMARALELFAQNFQAQCIQVTERHHVHKKDKPSGTAVFLQKTLEGVATKNTVLSEPVSIREGEIIGIHDVEFRNTREKIIFHHEALDRDVFAEGALRVALWIVNKKSGLYSMHDFFGGKR
jgi:4-hydroxy-tetrahydrodipicolinate reductase